MWDKISRNQRLTTAIKSQTEKIADLKKRDTMMRHKPFLLLASNPYDQKIIPNELIYRLKKKD